MKSTSTIKVVDKLIKQSSVFGNSGHRIVSDQDSVFTLHDFTRSITRMKRQNM